jgi:putative transposase
MVIWRRDTTNPLTCRWNAGCQFTNYRYTERLADACIAASIGSVDDSYHNAMAEALNGTYKAELIRKHGPWKARHQEEFATIERTDWCNTTRLHGEIGHIPPLEHESNWQTAHIPATSP